VTITADQIREIGSRWTDAEPACARQLPVVDRRHAAEPTAPTTRVDTAGCRPAATEIGVWGAREHG
jgi:hypothetical protein